MNEDEIIFSDDDKVVPVTPEGNFKNFKFDAIGATITGTLIEKKEVGMPGGSTAMGYKLADKDGQEWSFLGSCDLDRNLASVNVGSLVKIKYVENKKVGKPSPMKVFEVFAKNNNEVTIG